MKTCLNCQKEFEYKREAAKFCSDKCRVMYNRKNPKNAVTSVQMQVLYNAMMEKLGKIEFAAPQTVYDAPKLPSTLKVDEPLSFDKLKQNSVAYASKNDYEARLRAAEDGETLQRIGREIERSSLNRYEKQQLQAIGQHIYNDKFNF